MDARMDSPIPYRFAGVRQAVLYSEAALEPKIATVWQHCLTDAETRKSRMRSFPASVKQWHIRYFSFPVSSTAKNAFCGMSTLPIDFIRFLPSFCFAQSLRLRVMSPP